MGHDRRLHGLLPPITTPFENGDFSPARFADNIARWNGLPLDGYVVLGSNGEAPLLEESERSAVVRAARAAVPSTRLLVAGAGRESTAAACRAVREAFDLGVDAVLVGVPCYYKPAMTDQALREHFLRVADASPGPVLLYSVPVFTSLPIRAPLVCELLKHERIAGIKDSSGDLASLDGMLAAARAAARPVSVLVGNARLLAEGLLRGAAGGVLAVTCVASRACAELAAFAAAGRREEAHARSEAIDPLARLVTRAHGIGGLKAALDLLGFAGGDPRPPLPPATPAARDEIAARMRALGLLA